MGDVKIKEAKNIEAIRIAEAKNIDPLRIAEVKNIDPLRVSKIAPAAVHIKEVNHVDPLTVESLRIHELKNLDPVRVEEFNVTRLPMVNLSLRQMPPLDMNIRRIPPLSVGFHQDVHIPSNYTVRARLFGVEFFRMNMAGHTHLIPKDKARREQARSHERSHPLPAAAGNPAIPSAHEVHTTVEMTHHSHAHSHAHGHAPPHESPGEHMHGHIASADPLSYGQPQAGFSLSSTGASDAGPTVRGGGM